MNVQMLHAGSKINKTPTMTPCSSSGRLSQTYQSSRCEFRQASLRRRTWAGTGKRKMRRERVCCQYFCNPNLFLSSLQVKVRACVGEASLRQIQQRRAHSFKHRFVAGFACGCVCGASVWTYCARARINTPCRHQPTSRRYTQWSKVLKKCLEEFLNEFLN